MYCYFQVITELETSCLQDVWVDRREDDHTVIHLKFDYINPDRQTRDYVMESHEDSLVRVLFFGFFTVFLFSTFSLSRLLKFILEKKNAVFILNVVLQSKSAFH